MDAIKHLEQNPNQLAITFCPPTEPTGEVLNKYTNTFMYHSEENVSRKLIITRIPHIEWE